MTVYTIQRSIFPAVSTCLGVLGTTVCQVFATADYELCAEIQGVIGITPLYLTMVAEIMYAKW